MTMGRGTTLLAVLLAVIVTVTVAQRGAVKPVVAPVVVPSVPAVGPSVPAVGPSVPAVGPSVPAVGPSVPAVGPSVPAVGPSVPAVGPSVPAVGPAVVPVPTVSAGSAPVVKIGSAGETVTGEPSLNDAYGGFTFYGIKYGVADRFQDAIVNEDLAYLNDASRSAKGPKGMMCLQPTSAAPWTSTGVKEFGEDCLFLDIFVPPPTAPTTGAKPSNIPPAKKLPVFMWSWGGLMISGGRGIPGAGADLAASLKAIVVIPQFREGPFGFLSTGDAAAPGNFALSDLKAAFNWVYANIEKFGGDKARITVSGQSDGAALTSAMLLDTDIASRVFGAVTMSGSVLSPWAIDEEPINKAVALAKTASCPATPNSALIACLKKIPGKELEAFAEKTYDALPHFPGVPIWTMVVDGHHILYDPAWILNDTNRKGLIGGFVHQFNKQDASIVALRAFGKYLAGPGLPTLGFLKTIGIPYVVRQATLCANLSAAAIDLVARTYGIVAGADELTLRNAFYQLTTDVNHGLSTVKEAMLYSDTGATRLGNSVSVLGYDADISKFSPLANFTSGGGVYHTCDVGYLFSGAMSPLLAGQTDLEVTKVYRQQFNSLITRGYGLGESFQKDQQNHIELGQDKKWHKQKFARTVQLISFWDKLKELRCAPPPPNACGPMLPEAVEQPNNPSMPATGPGVVPAPNIVYN
ncbi:putative Bile salt-activated lipase [Hypsibius exemplaris]|uniref:Bile salt-activated lipase n=1 Tax=Hypsibius exemplaris TaxID=2072580 RepID=A0A9X6NCQ8_HYPEX|nr:putative Bile salt-activated lipase [Hypsibius exemplaris]